MVPNRTGLKLFLPSVLTAGAIALSSFSAWAGTPSAGSLDGTSASENNVVSFNPLPSREAGFAPRGNRTLRNTVSGGRRGSCGSSAVALKPLVPGEQGALTASANPSLWVYVPAGAGETARFRLTDAQEADLDEQTITLPKEGGLVKIALRDRGQALAVGQSYQWYLSVDCDRVAAEAPRSTFASGWIQRVNSEAATTAGSPLAAAAAYARAGIWYDAVNSVIEADRSGDRSAAWEALAASAGLDRSLVAVGLPDAP
jgi:hypothetical protein